MRVLVVSSGEKAADAIISLLKKESSLNLSKALSASTARRLILDEDFDLMVINYPLADDDEISLSEMAEETLSLPTIFLIKDELYPTFGLALENNGSLVVLKPIVPLALFSAIKIAKTLKKREEKLKVKIKNLEKKLEEQKTISRAKCTLMEKEKMSETKAHKTLEKMAMNNRVSLYETSLKILKDSLEE